MGKRTKTLAIIILAALATNLAHAADHVGVIHISATAQARSREINVTVWYPAQGGGNETTLGETAFFNGTTAARDAPVAADRFPLILLSHGAGLAGSPESLSWLAAGLANRGFVVAAPAHPGHSGKDKSALETIKIWQRPGDISATLDAIQHDPRLEKHLTEGVVGVLGLSMGGSTALALAGARIDPQRLVTYCDTDAHNASLCAWVRQSHIDMHAMDLAAAGRDYRDSRIRFAMAIDPAPVDVFDVRSFSTVTIPVELVNLGRPGAIPLTVDASLAADAIPSAHYSVVADASHFSLFGECKAGAPTAALAADIDEPICSDGNGRSRRLLHEALIEQTASAFRRHLSAP